MVNKKGMKKYILERGKDSGDYYNCFSSRDRNLSDILITTEANAAASLDTVSEAEQLRCILQGIQTSQSESDIKWHIKEIEKGE